MADAKRDKRALNVLAKKPKTVRVYTLAYFKDGMIPLVLEAGQEYELPFNQFMQARAGGAKLEILD